MLSMNSDKWEDIATMTHVSRAWIRRGGVLVLDRMTACDIPLCLKEVIIYESKTTCQRSLKLIWTLTPSPLLEKPIDALVCLSVYSAYKGKSDMLKRNSRCKFAHSPHYKKGIVLNILSPRTLWWDNMETRKRHFAVAVLLGLIVQGWNFPLSFPNYIERLLFLIWATHDHEPLMNNRSSVYFPLCVGVVLRLVRNLFTKDFYDFFMVTA